MPQNGIVRSTNERRPAAVSPPLCGLPAAQLDLVMPRGVQYSTVHPTPIKTHT